MDSRAQGEDYGKPQGIRAKINIEQAQGDQGANLKEEV
jgi:hypothetical protein